ncbi:MAG: helix-turn-helix domain-containing protein [Dehalococcoidia bacterium]|nr:helix-turn-helix domain-containing protein [Dehalococcoidia bacterium]
MNNTWSPTRIKALRAFLGLTQGGMAARLQVAQSTLASWEVGSRRPNRWLQDKLLELEQQDKPESKGKE